jgi:hypothetical protein
LSAVKRVTWPAIVPSVNTDRTPWEPPGNPLVFPAILSPREIPGLSRHNAIRVRRSFGVFGQESGNIRRALAHPPHPVLVQASMIDPAAVASLLVPVLIAHTRLHGTVGFHRVGGMPIAHWVAVTIARPQGAVIITHLLGDVTLMHPLVDGMSGHHQDGATIAHPLDAATTALPQNDATPPHPRVGGTRGHPQGAGIIAPHTIWIALFWQSDDVRDYV